MRSSVILLLSATEAAASGVILNQPIKTTLTELSGKIFAADFDWDKPICLGGPLASSLMVLHRDERLADNEVIPGVYFTADPSRVHALVELRPEPSLVLANYAAWGPGQLDGELDAIRGSHFPQQPSRCSGQAKKIYGNRLQGSAFQETRANARNSCSAYRLQPQLTRSDQIRNEGLRHGRRAYSFIPRGRSGDLEHFRSHDFTTGVRDHPPNHITINPIYKEADRAVGECRVKPIVKLAAQLGQRPGFVEREILGLCPRYGTTGFHDQESERSAVDDICQFWALLILEKSAPGPVNTW